LEPPERVRRRHALERMIRRTSVIFCVLVGLASAFLAGACRKPPDAGALGERGRPVVAATIFRLATSYVRSPDPPPMSS
jgi:hypothetical protein